MRRTGSPTAPTPERGEDPTAGREGPPDSGQARPAASGRAATTPVLPARARPPLKAAPPAPISRAIGTGVPFAPRRPRHAAGGVGCEAAGPPTHATTVDPQRARADRLVLSPDLGSFLIDLSIAVHRHAMYPGNHPSLAPTIAAVVRSAERLMADRPKLAIGVARDQLVIEGVSTDTRQALLRAFADRLHRHRLGAIVFQRGLDPAELQVLLQLLAADPDRGGTPIGAALDKVSGWKTIHLFSIDFDQLTLVEADAGAASEGRADHDPCAELWVGLARAALAREGQAPAVDADTAPTVVAKAIDEHPRVEAYDQVIVGYLLQIAGELQVNASREGAALRRRVSELVAHMRPETLRRLVAMGGDLRQRVSFTHAVATGLASEAVVEIFKAVADVSGETISHGLLRLLGKLARQAEHGPLPVRPHADTALREQVRQLVSGWKLADPNPAAYSRALAHLSQTTLAPGPSTARQGSPAERPEPMRILQMSIELDLTGAATERAFQSLVEAGDIATLLDGLASAPPGSQSALQLESALATPETVRALLAQHPIDFRSLDRLLPHLRGPALAPLFDLLASSETRSIRRALLDRLARLGTAVVPEALRRLNDPRWFVVRNVLAVLGGIQPLPDSVDVTPLLSHPEPRVRREALRLLLTQRARRPQALLTVLGQERSPLVLWLALAHIRRGCPPALLPHVVRLAGDASLPEELRIAAMRLIAASPEPMALEALLAAVSDGTDFLGRPRLARPTPLARVALRGLATNWANDARARRVLERASHAREWQALPATPLPRHA
jgi:hypothetical protein